MSLYAVFGQRALMQKRLNEIQASAAPQEITTAVVIWAGSRFDGMTVKVLENRGGIATCEVGGQRISILASNLDIKAEPAKAEEKKDEKKDEKPKAKKEEKPKEEAKEEPTPPPQADPSRTMADTRGTAPSKEKVEDWSKVETRKKELPKSSVGKDHAPGKGAPIEEVKPKFLPKDIAQTAPHATPVQEQIISGLETALAKVEKIDQQIANYAAAQGRDKLVSEVQVQHKKAVSELRGIQGQVVKCLGKIYGIDFKVDVIQANLTEDEKKVIDGYMAQVAEFQSKITGVMENITKVKEKAIGEGRFSQMEEPRIFKFESAFKELLRLEASGKLSKAQQDRLIGITAGITDWLKGIMDSLGNLAKWVKGSLEKNTDNVVDVLKKAEKRTADETAKALKADLGPHLENEDPNFRWYSVTLESEEETFNVGEFRTKEEAETKFDSLVKVIQETGDLSQEYSSMSDPVLRVVLNEWYWGTEDGEQVPFTDAPVKKFEVPPELVEKMAFYQRIKESEDRRRKYQAVSASYLKAIKFKRVGSNMSEIEVGGSRILISYDTPVAAITPDGKGEKTDKKWSVTTSGHINKWFAANGITESEAKPQEYFDNLMSGEPVKASKLVASSNHIMALSILSRIEGGAGGGQSYGDTPINSVADLENELAGLAADGANKSLYFVCADGGILSYADVMDEKDQIIDKTGLYFNDSVTNPEITQWAIVGWGINSVDLGMTSDHSGEVIPTTFSKELIDEMGRWAKTYSEESGEEILSIKEVSLMYANDPEVRSQIDEGLEGKVG